MDTAEKEKKVTVPKPKTSKKKKILIIVGAIVVFIVGLIIFVNMATSAPVKISDELISNIQAQDSEAAYDLMSSAAKAVIDRQSLAADIDRVGPVLVGKPKLISKEVAVATGSKNSSTIVYDIEGNDGFTYTFTVQLTENDGKWQVDAFDSDKQE